MRLLDLTALARIAALISCAALLSACPKKDNEAAPEPAASGAVQAPVSDKAGVEPAAPAATPAAAPASAAAAKKKTDDDKGGW
jgi:hypothetical protein